MPKIEPLTRLSPHRGEADASSLPPGAAARPRARHRSRQAQGLRPARPHRQARSRARPAPAEELAGDLEIVEAIREQIVGAINGGGREVATRRPMSTPAGMSDEQVLALYEPGSYEIVPHDTMRRFIAERLTLSKQTIPHFYLSIDCELDAVSPRGRG